MDKEKHTQADHSNQSDLGVPMNYTPPPAAKENYMKLESGENRIRILSSFIMGWEDWKEEGDKKTPVRFRENQRPESPLHPDGEIKMFWSACVWNYQLKKIQILHITQKSIQKALYKIAHDSDWGNVKFYDIKIFRTGDDQQTRYSVVPVPPSAVSKEIQKVYEKTNINLEALFDNEDPFKDVNKNSFEDFTPSANTQKKSVKRVA